MAEMVEVEVPEKGGIDSVDGFAEAARKLHPDHHVITQVQDLTYGNPLEMC